MIMDEMELLKGCCYQVDTNDGKERRGFFQKIIYSFSKPQFQFENFRHKKFTVNPSYVVATEESEPTEEELRIYNNVNDETMEY